VAVAYSSSPQMLIAARALLGIAGSTLMPSTLALITSMFTDTRQRATAIAIWGSCFGGGAALGPLVGGALLETFWWGAAFLLGVPVMVLLLVAGPVLLPEHRAPEAGRPDPVSVVLSLAAILPVVYGLKELARHGWQPSAAVAVAAGLVIGVVFVRRQRRLADPLLDVGLFRIRSFSTALGVALTAAATMGGVIFFVTQYLQLVQGLPPLRAGLWQLPAIIGMVMASMLVPMLAQRFGPGRVIPAGLVVGTVGFGLLTQVGSTSALTLVVIGLLLASLGIGPLGVLCTDLVVGSAPPDKTGSAASVSESSGEFGIALGVAALGSVGTAVYRGQVADALPAGVPAQTAAATKENLAAAVQAAQQLPAGIATELLGVAREAFTSGLNVVAGVGATATLAMAFLSLVLLWDPRGHVHTHNTEATDSTQPPTAEPVSARD
jgi:DHA2 family multidrug resistance protein-like MFS transporter